MPANDDTPRTGQDTPPPSRFDLQPGDVTWGDDGQDEGSTLEERMADFEPGKLGRMDEPPGGWPQPDDEEQDDGNQ